MKNKLWWVVIGLLLFSLACTTLTDSGDDLTPTQDEMPEVELETEEPIVEETKEPPATEEATLEVSNESGGFTIQVANESDYEICYVFISPSESEDWGADWMDSEETILSGGARDFDLPAGTYDVKVSNCELETLATDWELAVDSTVQVGGSGRVALELSNLNETDICYAQLSPSSLETWGEDALGDKELLISGASRVFFLQPGTYDVLLSDCDEAVLAEEYELEITVDTAWQLTDQGLVMDGMVDDGLTEGDSFSLDVANESDYDLCYVYISSSTGEEWGADWLGEGEIIVPGDFWSSGDIPAGPHDIKLETCSGAVLATAWEMEFYTSILIGGFGKVPLEVVNDSSDEICYAYFSFSTADEWGMDWMGLYETVQPGGMRIFYLEPGTYDLMVEDCDGNDLVTELEVVIGTDGTTWTVSD